MSKRNASTARRLRTHLNALSLDLSHCTTPAEVRAVKIAIRQAELELTALGAA